VMRAAIVGLGKMGCIRAAELERHPRAQIVIGADPSAERRRAFKSAPTVADWRCVLESKVDAVFVSTPNRFTPEIVTAALRAGKHVFAEKPPGRTLEDVERMIDAETRNPEVRLKFGFNHRYHAGILEAKRIVDSGRLGRILWIRAVYGKSGGPRFEEEWRSSTEMSGGGILLDQGIHMLDLFRFLCGDFSEVKSMVTTAFWDIPMEDNAFALLRDDQGRIAMLHSSSTQWKHRFQLEVYMSGGSLTVNGILSSTRSYGDETITIQRTQSNGTSATGNPPEETLYFDTDPSWELEVDEFVGCVLDGNPVKWGTSKDAYAAMDLVYRVYRADERWAHRLADGTTAAAAEVRRELAS
jgi:predicted dehydrogenase